MFSSGRYQLVPSTIYEDQAPESHAEKGSRSLRRETSSRSPNPWMVSTLLLAILATYLGAHTYVQSAPSKSIPFSTDFKAAQPWIEYEERVFTGKLTYDPIKQHPYRDIDPTQPQYFGKPSPEIEKSWDDLLHNEFTPMTANEAAPFTPDFRPLPTDGKYHFELDVLHSLHCLNSVRKKLYQYMYQMPRTEDNETVSSTDPNDWEHVHMDHCLDQLRQSIQCHGDLTPVLLYWWDGYGTALAQGQTHTCRNWENIREWVDRRNIGLDETRS
jgi:hypothetical protein